jgi:hypothetical protein
MKCPFINELGNCKICDMAECVTIEECPYWNVKNNRERAEKAEERVKQAENKLSEIEEVLHETAFKISHTTKDENIQILQQQGLKKIQQIIDRKAE